MKTNLNFLRGYNTQGTVAKSVLAIVCFVLSLTVSDAQDSTKLFIENNVSSQIEMAMVDNSKLNLLPKSDEPLNKKIVFPDFLKNVEEENLETENWMFNEKLFEPVIIRIETVKEEPLKLESWMTKEQLWVTK